jgi:predicted nucleic-acid-binding protein
VTVAIDTNVLARYLTWDDEAQAVAAAAVIEAAEPVSISTIVLCELAWVLKRAYRYTAAEIAMAIAGLVTSANMITDRVAAEAGLAMLRQGGDFADGIIQHEASRARCRHIVTFDRDFARRLDPARVALLG